MFSGGLAGDRLHDTGARRWQQRRRYVPDPVPGWMHRLRLRRYRSLLFGPASWAPHGIDCGRRFEGVAADPSAAARHRGVVVELFANRQWVVASAGRAGPLQRRRFYVDLPIGPHLGGSISVGRVSVGGVGVGPAFGADNGPAAGLAAGLGVGAGEGEPGGSMQPSVEADCLALGAPYAADIWW